MQFHPGTGGPGEYVLVPSGRAWGEGSGELWPINTPMQAEKAAVALHAARQRAADIMYWDGHDFTDTGFIFDSNLVAKQDSQTRRGEENPRDEISTMDLVVFGGVALVSVGIVVYAYLTSKTAASIQAAPSLPVPAGNVSGPTLPPNFGVIPTGCGPTGYEPCTPVQGGSGTPTPLGPVT
jgi:hypothetical protein